MSGEEEWRNAREGNLTSFASPQLSHSCHCVGRECVTVCIQHVLLAGSLQVCARHHRVMSLFNTLLLYSSFCPAFLPLPSPSLTCRTHFLVRMEDLFQSKALMLFSIGTFPFSQSPTHGFLIIPSPDQIHKKGANVEDLCFKEHYFCLSCPEFWFLFLKVKSYSC